MQSPAARGADPPPPLNAPCNTIAPGIADLLPHAIVDHVTEWHRRLEAPVKGVVASDVALAKDLGQRVQGWLAKFQHQQQKEAMQVTGKAARGVRGGGGRVGRRRA